MEKLLNKESYLQAVENIKKIQTEIRQFIPIVKEELRNLSDSDFIFKVCNGRINEEIRAAKEGDRLFECSFHNKRYFDSINQEKNQEKKKENRESVDKPGINVNVAGLSKFIIDCPHAGEFLCKLRYFKFESKKEEEKI
jgi:hypothetical protein